MGAEAQYNIRLKKIQWKKKSLALHATLKFSYRKIVKEKKPHTTQKFPTPP